MRRTYIAIDPGGTTGVAELVPFEMEPRTFQMSSTFEVADYITDAWEGIGWDAEHQLVVIYEKFTISQRTLKATKTYDALYLNGWLIHYFRHLRPGDGIVLVQQTPAEAKSFATDKKLKAVGWYTPGKDHANDAARHLLLAVAKDHASGRVDHSAVMKKLEEVL